MAIAQAAEIKLDFSFKLANGVDRCFLEGLKGSGFICRDMVKSVDCISMIGNRKEILLTDNTVVT